MRKLKFSFAFAAIFCCVSFGFAAEKIDYASFDYDSLIRSLEYPQEPLITDDYIVFTMEGGHRFVGIAFDFENFQVIHPFQILRSYDVEGDKTRELMFYCYERKHIVSSFKYRLVIDGLWTSDPYNPHKVYDDNINLYFSVIDDPGSVKVSTEQKDGSDMVRFVYKGTSGLKLRLGGTFTNWDPWIYTMNETSPGFYELELPLPVGKYYYNYYVGLTPLVDNTNPEKAYSSDGREISVITVK